MVLWGLWKFTLIDYLIVKWFCTDCLKSFHIWVKVTAFSVGSDNQMRHILMRYVKIRSCIWQTNLMFDLKTVACHGHTVSRYFENTQKCFWRIGYLQYFYFMAPAIAHSPNLRGLIPSVLPCNRKTPDTGYWYWLLFSKCFLLLWRLALAIFSMFHSIFSPQ